MGRVIPREQDSLTKRSTYDVMLLSVCYYLEYDLIDKKSEQERIAVFEH